MTHTATIRLLTVLVAVVSAGRSVASAQTPPVALQNKRYAEAVAQSAFGNATSQSYGVEAGATVRTNIQVFGEFGQIRTVATPELGANANIIAAFVSQDLGSVTASVKEPVKFGAVGVRYLIPIMGSRLQPYVLGAVGIAHVTKDVKFLSNGADITPTLNTLVTLGSDLQGDFSKTMITFGGGAVWPLWRQIIADFQFRYSHIGAEDETGDPISVGRAGIGIGVRF